MEAGLSKNLRPNVLLDAIRFGAPLNAILRILQLSPEVMKKQINGRYPLSHAVWHGSPVEIVRALYVSWPESVGAVNSWDGRLPLHNVSGRTPAAVVKFLIDVYPEALKVKAGSCLPIHFVIKCRLPFDAIRDMVERYPNSLLVPDGDGYLPIHLAASQRGDFGLVEYLANRRPESLGVATRKQKQLPIHFAARFGTMREVELLTSLRPESLGVADIDGRLPIHLAAASQRSEVIEFLVDQRPETIVATTVDGLLPVQVALESRDCAAVLQHLAVGSIPEATRVGLMHFAVRAIERLATNSVVENVRALADALPRTLLRASLRATNSEGSLPIHVAVQYFNLFSSPARLIELLVELDPECLLVPNDAGELPLHKHIAMVCSTRWWAMDTPEFLIRCAPQSVLVAGSDGNLPIHTALINRWFELVKCIVEHCPQGAQARGARGRTPLHIVATIYPFDADDEDDDSTIDSWDEDDEDDLPSVASLLIRRWPESLLEGDADGNLPIHVAIECLKGTWACTLVRFLLRHSPDSPRVAGAGGQLPLHAAVSKTDPPLKLVERLLDTWTDAVDVRDASGNLPLHAALANPRASLDIIYTLVRAKPEQLRSGNL